MTAQPASPRRDLHADVTAKIIAALEDNPGQSRLPWRRRSGSSSWIPRNAAKNTPYNGINFVNLIVATQMRGFSAPIFATYRQWQELGAQVRRGEKAEQVIFYKAYDVTPHPDTPDDDGKRRVAKCSYAFNIDQVDGAETPPQPELLPPIERLAHVDRFIANTQAKILIGGDRAFYRPSTDTVHMPEEGLFTGTDTMNRQESFLAVELHELCHWSGAERRLNRKLRNRFGISEYAAEELVALSGRSGRGLSGQSQATRVFS